MTSLAVETIPPSAETEDTYFGGQIFLWLFYIHLLDHSDMAGC